MTKWLWLGMAMLLGAAGSAQEVVIRPTEYPRAFRNPLKGFLGGEKQEYATMDRRYVRWCEIEESAADGVDKLRAYADREWRGVAERNVKIIPRVFLEWPAGPAEDEYAAFWSWWPRDMPVHDYQSERFRARLVRMIEKMGQAWDEDPRIAFVEMGLVGAWGEQHHPRPDEALQKLLGDAFRASFRHKLVMIRYPVAFGDYPFGIYWDSFGAAGWEVRTHVPELEGRLAERWKTAPMGGEVDPQHPAFGGETGELTHIVRDRADTLVCYIRRWHWNMLGWLSGYDAADPATARNAERVQKAFGYRFVLDEVRYPARVDPGGGLAVSLLVRNVGSAPFYYDWPLEVSLLDPATRQPAWQATFPGVDIRTWLPGSFSDLGQGRPVPGADGKVSRYQWDTGLEYDLQPAPVAVRGTFTLPESLPRGTYVLALAILDPAGNLPSARFAITNYWRGGRHPLGRIGVGTAPGRPELDQAELDDLQADRSLHYLLQPPS